MTDYVTDREQIELIKRWWNDYGKWVAIAIVVGLIVGFGWRYWRQQKVAHAEQASVIYQSMASAVSKNQEKVALKYSATLMKKYANTPYASLAAFLWASDAVAKKDLSLALSKLQWVIQKSNVVQFKQIARIRAAQILVQQKKTQQALTTLAKVDDKTFKPMIAEVQGDAYAAEGNVAAARKAYEQASLGLMEIGTVNPLLTMKLVQPTLKPYSINSKSE